LAGGAREALSLKGDRVRRSPRGVAVWRVVRALAGKRRTWLLCVASAGLFALPSMALGASPVRAMSVTTTSATDPVIAAAGDIACDPTNTKYNGGAGHGGRCRMAATAQLLTGFDAVLPLGDEQYDIGALAAFKASYDHSGTVGTGWGTASNPIAFPTPGNHEYGTSGASGYFSYFSTAGRPTGATNQGWYSFTLGAWHLISLNANCPNIGGCDAGSDEYTWLENDLVQDQSTCVLAFFHQPLFTSGTPTTTVRPLWQLLYDDPEGTDVILNGHSHFYERFDPQDPTGTADPNGIREFIVGTGGESHGSFKTTPRNSVVRNASTFGVLRLRLHATSYDWKFIHIAGASFKDSGSAACVAPTA
jgi:hypothetical protein